MKVDFRVYPHFYEEICANNEDFSRKQEALNIHHNSVATVSHVRNQMRLAGLDYLVLHAQDESSIDGAPLMSNEDIHRLVSAHSDMFMGIASVDPNQQDSTEELARAFNELGLLGLRLNLSRLKLSPMDAKVWELLDVCQEFKKPVIFEAGISFDSGYSAKFANPALYEDLVIKYPQVKFCFTRCAWPFTREVTMLMMKYKNVFTDTGVLYFGSAKEFNEYLFHEVFRASWVDRSLNHQIMFASENPRFEQIRMVHATDQLDLHPDTKRRILGQNALDFLGVNYE